MPGFRRLAFFLFPAILIGCNTIAPPDAVSPSQQEVPMPTPTEKPQFVAAPIPTPTPPPPVPANWPKVLGKSGNYFEDFSEANVNLADWKDPRKDDGYKQPWLYSGNWYIAPAYQLSPPAIDVGDSSILAIGKRAFEYNDMQPQPALSFRRYAGKAFGTPDGQLPARYSVSLRVTPIASREDFYPPVGDQGTPVYYLDPQHYVEVLIKPDTFEVWQCNGSAPLKWRGWRMLYQADATHSAGVPVQLGADVNSNDGTIRVYQNGQFMREVKSSIVKPYTHYFALRAGSNHVQFTDIQIQGY